MSVTIVFAVPFGPSPWAMNNGTILGKELPAFIAVFVVVGLGLYIYEPWLFE